MFHKYPSITNSYDQEFIDKIKSYNYNGIQYSITEKIHGINTQIAYYPNENRFVYGTRERELPENEHSRRGNGLMGSGYRCIYR